MSFSSVVFCLFLLWFDWLEIALLTPVVFVQRELCCKARSLMRLKDTALLTSFGCPLACLCSCSSASMVRIVSAPVRYIVAKKSWRIDSGE
jgi:hypothetical protein